MISVVEKELAIKYSINYFEGPEGMLLFKILANFTAKTIGLKDLQNIGDSVFTDKETMLTSAEKLMECIANIAASDKSSVEYTTGDMAVYFGVSITTINNWITKEGL